MGHIKSTHSGNIRSGTHKEWNIESDTHTEWNTYTRWETKKNGRQLRIERHRKWNVHGVGHTESDTQEWNTHRVGHMWSGVHTEGGTHGGRDIRMEGHTRSGAQRNGGQLRIGRHREWNVHGVRHIESDTQE